MYPKPRFSGRRLAVLGMLAALSLAVHTIESAFPPLFGIPGAKLGLSNLFSMLALVVYGPLDAFCILLARTLLGALIGGSASSLLFSLSGYGFETCFTASFLLLGNIGIGMADVGPSGNFSIFSDFLLSVGSFLMLVGRLELFTVYALFTRSFWKR